MFEITIYEDNSGAVYLGNGIELWGLGPVTRDLEGTAVEHAQAWATGEWEPNEQDGQVRADCAGLSPIAIWDAEHGLNIVRCGPYHDLVAGAGGRKFLGLTSESDDI